MGPLNNDKHPNADTLPVIKHNLVGGLVMPGGRLPGSE
jgi:hypothetical protein